MLNAREKREWPKSSLGKDTFHVCHVLSFYEVCAGAVACDAKLLSKRLNTLRFMVVFNIYFLFVVVLVFRWEGRPTKSRRTNRWYLLYNYKISNETFLWTNKALELFVCQLKFFRKHYLNENAVSNRLSHPRKRTLFEKRVQLTSLYRP